MKKSLIEELSVMLLRKGFIVKNLSRGCFDIFVRSEDSMLLLKVLEDANAVSQEYASEMEKIAAYINAVPLIIARKAGIMLENNIVYARFNIYTLNIDTFISAINNNLPFIKKSNAGITASILGERVREKREELGLSQHALSQKIGISSRTVSDYEKGIRDVTISKAFKLYELFGGSVFRRINLFRPRSSVLGDGTSAISRKYSSLGFNASDTRNVPFDVIAKKDREIILTELGDKAKPGLESLSRLMEADRLVIYSKNKPKDVPSMKKGEFLEIQKAKELIKLVRVNR